jgi:hypothetical protein
MSRIFKFGKFIPRGEPEAFGMLWPKVFLSVIIRPVWNAASGRNKRNGTTHVLLTPEELIAKLAALVPAPRTNLVQCRPIRRHAQWQTLFSRILVID